jgi:hypothetical protein
MSFIVADVSHETDCNAERLELAVSEKLQKLVDILVIFSNSRQHFIIAYDPRLMTRAYGGGGASGPFGPGLESKGASMSKDV